jgi:hypothetical protein
VDAGPEAAGLEHRPPYALRHSFAAWSIAAGIGLFELARMGTSVEQIDRTYGHLLPDSIERARTGLDSFRAMNIHASEGLCHLVDTARELTTCRNLNENPRHSRGFPSIGAPRFELGTSSPPD